MATAPVERCSASQAIRDVQIKSSAHGRPTREAGVKDTECGQDVSDGNAHTRLAGVQNGAAFWRNI